MPVVLVCVLPLPFLFPLPCPPLLPPPIYLTELDGPGSSVSISVSLSLDKFSHCSQSNGCSSSTALLYVCIHSIYANIISFIIYWGSYCAPCLSFLSRWCARKVGGEMSLCKPGLWRRKGLVKSPMTLRYAFMHIYCWLKHTQLYIENSQV